MSKRRHDLTTPSAASQKKQRSSTFGAAIPSDADLLAPQNVPSSSSISTRKLQWSVQTLLQISMSVFSQNIAPIFEQHATQVQQTLKILPEGLIPKLLVHLAKNRPSILSHGLLVAYFIRGREITLTGDMLGVNVMTIQAIRSLRESLTHLSLTNLTKFEDSQFATVIRTLPLLETLILRGCTKAGPATATAASQTCTRLNHLNLDRTNTNPESIAAILGSCKDLEVLKLESVPNLTPQAVTTYYPQIVAKAAELGFVPFIKLTTLKLRGTRINDSTLATIIEHTPNLQKLDISFTSIRNPWPIKLTDFTTLPLEKLSITQVPVPPKVLLDTLPHFPHLKKLHMGALNGVAHQATTVTDSLLRSLTDVLVDLVHLEQVNLVGNAKLGLSGPKGGGALADFITRVGRRCTALNLDNIPRLHSEDLEGLLVDEENPSPLATLTLSNTSVGDDAAVYIASCTSLTTLELANTQFTYDGIFTIVDGCARLNEVDLTSCRGIKVGDRRQIFQIWEERRAEDTDSD